MKSLATMMLMFVASGAVHAAQYSMTYEPPSNLPGTVITVKFRNISTGQVVSSWTFTAPQHAIFKDIDEDGNTDVFTYGWDASVKLYFWWGKRNVNASGPTATETMINEFNNKKPGLEIAYWHAAAPPLGYPSSNVPSAHMYDPKTNTTKTAYLPYMYGFTYFPSVGIPFLRDSYPVRWGTYGPGIPGGNYLRLRFDYNTPKHPSSNVVGNNYFPIGIWGVNFVEPRAEWKQ